MLLERIDVHAGSSAEPIQLGPFSHRLNGVFGPPGSGKTATIEFVRSVMLGTDRHWPSASTGSVVWSDRDGLIHCRREVDGTPSGRFSVDLVARDGAVRDFDMPHAAAPHSQTLTRVVALPRPIIHALIAPQAQTSLREIWNACRDAGLDAPPNVADQTEILELRRRIADLDAQLEKYQQRSGGRADLEGRRQELVDYLGHLDRQERTPPEADNRRQSLELRATDARDEIARLRLQEKDLRTTLTDVERQLIDLASMSPTATAPLAIAEVRRLQLEELDQRLVRLCQTLRDLRLLHSRPLALDNVLPPSYLDTAGRFYGTLSRRDSFDHLRSRIEAVRQNLEWLIRYPDHNESDSVVRSLRALTSWLLDAGSSDISNRAGTSILRHDETVRSGESALIQSIRRLADARDVLLRQVSREHQIPLDHLLAAFGDWRQCQDAPHLYEWLLSDAFPPHGSEAQAPALRLADVERQHRELLDELSRTANRLDDLISELRVLEGRLRNLPHSLPVTIDHRRRAEARAELADVERQLRWLDSSQSLDDERQQLRRRLGSLESSVRSESPLLTRASYWLDLLSGGHLSQISLRGDGSIRTEGRPSQDMSDTERQTAELALRMAAADALQQRGTLIPLLVDEPSRHWLGNDAVRRLANVFAKFTDAGQQMVVFTSDRALLESIGYVGGQRHTIAPAHFYHLRYRENRAVTAAVPPVGLINRELDTAWREANGVYDDPHWYRVDRDSRPRRAPGGRRNTSERFDVPPPSDPRDLGIDHWPAMPAPRQPASPFFLTEASPVDAAPSIDAVAAGRLQTLGICTVGNLLAANPRSVAQHLELADVTTGVVQRWQNESRLVCGVPQLRNFDARVLVGCGFTDPHQLAKMHPGRLLDRVEAFLTTERGRQILRSGTSYELSRITSWIAAANRSVARASRHGRTEERRGEDHRREERRREQRRRDRAPRHGRQAVAVDALPTSIGYTSDEVEPKFYLHRHSDIVDAPSIGPKTAARLQACGFATVKSLLAADPTTIEAKLNNRRITKLKIRRWQQQAALMCDVPLLRCHDAQLLVEASVYDARGLAQADASRLLARLEPIVRSAEGKRILRGGNRPDLSEVTGWIKSAQHARQVRAA